MESNFNTPTLNIFNQAIQLSEQENYSELPPTNNYKECDVLVVNHDSKKFWFTTKNTFNHTKKLINLA